MRYVSTRGASPPLGFDEVLLRGTAPDGGLYVPDRWPALPSPRPGGYAEVAEQVVAPFVEGSVVADRLAAILADAYAGFRHPEVAPIRRLADGLHLLELFWGPTLSFKDYALQLVGRLFDEVLRARGRRVLVLAATSGDTGSAAIEACRDRDAVDIVVLYPEGRISEVQRRQMTTVDSPNVHAVAVEGTFDDCQDLVKGAFADATLRDDLGLAAVNSINWARVMAQAAYYAWSAVSLPGTFSVAVPTGNYGNVFAAWAARRMGLPLDRLIVANNANHGVADFVETGRLPRSDVVPTLAPAMDIQVPSNLERQLFESTGRDGEATAAAMRGFRETGTIVVDEVAHTRLRSTFSSWWLDDAGIEEAIAVAHREEGMLLDPHTAVAWSAARSLRREGEDVLVVATAHPAKFPDAVAAATGQVPELPPDLRDILERGERTETIPVAPGALADLLRRVAAA